MMKCKCIDEVNKSIQEQTGDNKARLNTGIDMEGEPVIYLEYQYRKKSPDGRLGKSKVGTVIVSHCPFCGKKVK